MQNIQKTLKLNNKKKKSDLKMGESPEQTPHQRRYTNANKQKKGCSTACRSSGKFKI